MNARKITYISGKHLAKAYFSVIALFISGILERGY